MAQKKILVADDSRTIRKAIEITFAKTDFVLQFAQSGQSAWEKIKSLSPDIAILDHRMDPPNGYDLCERVKADPSTKHIQTVLLYSAKCPLNEEKGDLADARLVKPFETQALLDLADRLAQVEVARAAAPAVTAKPAAPATADDIPMGLTLDDEEEFDEIEIEIDEPEIEIDEPEIEIPVKSAAPPAAPSVVKPAPPPAAPSVVKPAAPPSAPAAAKPAAPPFAPAAAKPAASPFAPAAAKPAAPPSTPAAAKPAASPFAPAAAKPAAPPSTPAAAKPAAPPSTPAAKTPPWVPSKPKAAPWVPSTAKPAAPPSAPVVKPAAKPEAEPADPDQLKETAAPTTAPQAPKLSMKPLSSLAAAIKGDKRPEVTPAGAKGEAIEQVSGKSTPDKAAVSTEPRQAFEAGPSSLTTKAVEATLESIKKKGPEYEAIADLSMEMIEKIVWEVVPELAEVIIKENLDKLTRNKTGL